MNRIANLSTLDRLFPGESEMAARMRTFDWSKSELGNPEEWPSHLQTAIRICLTSRFPISIFWGKNLLFLYNDGIIPFLGQIKHPRALGRRAIESWGEIWTIINPMLRSVFATGRATWSEDLNFFFSRELPEEEVYVTFTYGPILAEDGQRVDGIFCPCRETTDRVVAARRLETLRRLSTQAPADWSVAVVCRETLQVALENPQDIPLAALYLPNEEKTELSLCSTAGLEGLHPLPKSLSLKSTCSSPWPIATVFNNSCAEEVDLRALGIKISGRPWFDLINKIVIVPVPLLEGAAGVLVIGVSPRRVLDFQYRSFFDLIASHIGTAVSKAQAYETERKRAEALAALDRTKTAFFSNVSHEFRTPLTLMLAPLEDAMASLSDKAQEDIGFHLKTAHRNAIRLLKLVNTLLDFSRIEAGRIQASFEPTDITAFTLELAGVFRSAIERAGLQLDVDCSRVAEPVYIDREMWEKIVLNLLSNAFKFTFKGRIQVRLEQVNKNIELRVIDTGTGIAKKEVPRIFERFHRIEGAKGRTYEGSGIGLALIQELAHLHGGSVRVESELGRGSTFVVSIPTGMDHLPQDRISAHRTLISTATRASVFVDEANSWLPASLSNVSLESGMPAVDATVPTSSHQPEVTEARILIVDDNADMREYLRNLLAQKWAVELAPDGEAALVLARQSHFDLILTDVMMPILDGFGLLREVRADPRLKSTPVIMLSARAGEESRVEGLQAGADDYLIKPFSAREIIARIETHLKLSARRQLAADNAALIRLHDVSLKMITKADLATLLEAILDAALEVSEASMGTVQLYNPTTQSLDLIAHRGFPRSFLDHFKCVRDQPSVCREALVKGHRVIVENVSTSDIFKGTSSLEILTASGVRAIQSTPLVARDGRVLGMFSTHWNESREMDHATLRILDLLAREAADLIEHRQREEELRHAHQEAVQANRSKDEFLAILSHELRTPLTAILCWAQLLRTGRVRDDRVKLGIQAIEESAQAQGQLINDLLDISRIVTGKLSLNLEKISLTALLIGVIDLIRPAAEKKAISISERFFTDAFVEADPARMKQVFWNLLSNSVKFTPQGGRIEVSLVLISDPSKGRSSERVSVTIRDSGKGINPAFLPNVFNRFSQADSSSIRVHGGLGLGLALVKNLLEIQNGTVTAESPGEGKGSTFTVTLPRVEFPLLAQLSSVISKIAEEDFNLPGLRVLFVEDEERTREVLGEALTSFGAEVQLASSAKEGFQIFQKSGFDVIISDIGMPEEDGYTFIHKIRDLETETGRGPIPALALTAFAGSAHLDRALATGFQAHLAKPIDNMELVRILKMIAKSGETKKS